MTRKEAIEFLKNMIDRESIGFVCPKGDGDVAVLEYHVTALNMAIKALKQPERKKGKWLPDNNNYYEERFICSVCGKSYKVDTCMGKPMWDFCPCGADMREEGDHE